jgi:hypothetical protein
MKTMDSNNRRVLVSRSTENQANKGSPSLFEGWSRPVHIDPRYKWEHVWAGATPQGYTVQDNGLGGGVNGGRKD